MYLHLGSEVSVYSGDIIGIFDYELSKTPSFQEFIHGAEWQNIIHTLEGKTKSVVVALDKIYYSPVSRATLVKRWKRYSKQFTSFGESDV